MDPLQQSKKAKIVGLYRRDFNDWRKTEYSRQESFPAYMVGSVGRNMFWIAQPSRNSHCWTLSEATDSFS